MRYAKRIIAFLVLSAILLCMPLFSVSAASFLTDWVPWQPYKSDFISPAGSNSVVFDFARNDNVYRRLVLPDGAESIQCLVEQNGCLVSYVAYGDNAGSYMYYGANFSSYNYLKSSKPELDGYYSYRIYVDLKTYGIVCNSSTVNFVDQWDLHIIKPFPDENLIEEKKTQGMISQLISDIADWFSNLIEKMGNFFTELGNKIGGFFTDLANKIGDFFTKLWNKIWWGNEAGESEYEPPDVGSKFDEVIASLNDWLSQLKGFSDTVDSQGDEVADYISTGSDFATKFLTYAPAPILIFLTFGIVFVVVRKVVGR